MIHKTLLNFKYHRSFNPCMYVDREVNQVVVINFTYANIASEEDLYIYSSRFKVIDGDGNMCSIYPTSTSLYPKSTPMGAKCTAEEAYGLLSDKKIVN